MTGTAEILTGPWCGAARWWFGALDCRSFVVGGREWTAHVAGIHVARFDVWIQLDMAGVVPRSLVLHITRGMNVPDAVAAIESMIAVDGDSPTEIETPRTIVFEHPLQRNRNASSMALAHVVCWRSFCRGRRSSTASCASFTGTPNRSSGSLLTRQTRTRLKECWS